MSDEGFHEIQLNGKQLIFLCMTAALVLVVAFLSGVLVGRGVHSQKDPALVAADTAPVSAPGESGVGDSAPATGAASATQAPAPPPITAIAPPTPTDEDLSYDTRLDDKQPPKETVKPEPAGARKPAVAPALPATPAARPDAAKAKPAAAVPGEPAGEGYYLKVVAYRERSQADAVAKRLTGRGYNAYVVPLSGRGPVLYSVRVGKYKTRREADSTRRRLEKEEQLKPLISH